MGDGNFLSCAGDSISHDVGSSVGRLIFPSFSFLAIFEQFFLHNYTFAQNVTRRVISTTLFSKYLLIKALSELITKSNFIRDGYA